MAIAGGLSSQFGIGEEVTPGTAVTPTRFFEFNEESLGLAIERIESKGLRTGRRTQRSGGWAVGHRGVEGDVSIEIQNKGQAILWKYLLGACTTTTPGGGTLSRSHKCTVGDIDGKSLTLQVGRGDTGGTAQPFTYNGAKIATWELSNEVDGIPMLKLTFDAMDEVTATALASASYPTALFPMTYTGGVIQVAGSNFDVKDVSFEGDNGLARERYLIRATNPGTKKQQLESEERVYTGKLTAEFDNLTAYNRFVNGTEASLKATWTGSIIEGAIPYKLEINCPAVRFDGETPKVGGAEIIDLELPFKILDDQLGDGPLIATVVNVDTAP